MQPHRSVELTGFVTVCGFLKRSGGNVVTQARFLVDRIGNELSVSVRKLAQKSFNLFRAK